MLKYRPVTAAQIQTLDRIAIEKTGIPALVLMENAGRAVAECVVREFAAGKKGPVVIFCGTGNNGGDGLVAARHLVNAGMRVKIFLVGKASGLKADAAVHCRILKNCGYPVVEIAAGGQDVRRAISRAGLIVDAIFGVGLNRDVEDPVKSFIAAINGSGAKVVAVDVPSGLDATTGKIHGACVIAAATVTFTLPKKGFYKNDGPRAAGRIIVADIGIPRKLWKDIFHARDE